MNATEPMLTVTGLVKTFAASKDEGDDRVSAVDGIDFVVERGHLFTLLGPSGCGKTTTLRCIAGLERPDDGAIRLDGQPLVDIPARINVPANQRGLGMVFQSYAIWPHMDVFRNVAFPLQVAPRSRRPSRKQIEERVGRVLDVVRLADLAGRRATDLSGGQQQRLALARALVLEPPLLLLDEPLSNLDAQLREEMRFELKRLQRDLGITSIYVTHDQVEALSLANRIAVMRDGRIEQVGRPREIYQQPATRFVASFIGTTNFIEGRVDGRGDATGTRVATDHGVLQVDGGSHLPHGTPVVISVRPENITVAPVNGEVRGWRGRVLARAFLGEAVDHVVQVGDRQLQARGPTTVSLRPGTEVDVVVDSEHAAVMPADA